ncbi:MAG: arginine-tRNA-protein transferase [Bacteroidota bacterium]|nr:arginine-tRNA-protein transferase [Bacteroidota bacterium]
MLYRAGTFAIFTALYFMINDIHFPEELSANELDEYLARGWYRMGQVIFTTNYIVYEELLYRVWWLRYSIPAIQFSKTHQKILAANRHFSVIIKPFRVTEEIEALYAVYKSSLIFEPSETVNHFLFDGGSGNIYDTGIIEIRDHQQLIAAGIFDKGHISIAGIMNFYHPDYKKYSLGKYLMLLKIRYANAMGKAWYYPGYIVDGNPRFDYKLFIGKTIAGIWSPEYNNWMEYTSNRQVIEEEK